MRAVGYFDCGARFSAIVETTFPAVAPRDNGTGRVDKTTTVTAFWGRPSMGTPEADVSTWPLTSFTALQKGGRFSNRPVGVKHLQTATITTVSLSLTGSRFSSESAPRPFHYGIRGRGGTIYRAALPSHEWQVQATKRTHLVHRPARDIFPPQGGARVSSYRI